MKTIVFLVQGSAESPYELSFEQDGKRIMAFCTCPAGERGMYCKRRFSILNGFDPGIISGNSEQVSIVNSWLPNSNLDTCMAELAEGERGLELAKSALAKAKMKLAATMMGR